MVIVPNKLNIISLRSCYANRQDFDVEEGIFSLTKQKYKI